MSSILGSKIPFKEGDYVPRNIIDLKAKDEELRQKHLTEAAEAKEQAIKEDPFNGPYIQPKGKFGYNNSTLREASSVASNMKKNLFIEMVYRIFYKSLILDESFKQTAPDKLRQFVAESIQGEGGDFDKFFNNLKSKSPILSELCAFCENTAEDKASDALLSGDEDETKTVFTIEIEDEEIDKALNDISADELAAIIIEKVTKVIMKEKEDDKARENMMAELVDTINGNDDNDDDDDDDDNDDDEDDENAPPTDVQIEESLRKIHPINEYSLFKSLMISSHKNILSESETLKDSSYLIEQDGGELKVNMDYVLAEAITRYTLMETLYTLKILDMNVQQVRNMSTRLAYE